MNRTLALLLSVAFFLVATHQLPAPIAEESPTPAPKRTIKHNTSEDSQRPTKRQTPSPPKNQATPNRNPFDGTWIGTVNNLPFVGDVVFTLVITASGSGVRESSPQTGIQNFRAACDGSTMKWKAGSNFSWTFVLNPDGKTALAIISCPGVFGIGLYNSTTIFRKISP